ncbi:hypothetical protein GGF46_003077 [Coemansia sp. RSA 552]|nr:hypothetical protein GGF46_003077 [Coemansia sp. RSA 552]
MIRTLRLANARLYSSAPSSLAKQRRGRTQKAEQAALLPGQFLVGLPDPVSNIRPIKFYIPDDETAVEQQYRELREEAARRDHEFWKDNNMRFETGKLAFEQQTVERSGQCTLDDLSEYYKQYQVDSHARHLCYNRYVWRRNWQMVWPGIRAWCVEIWRRRTRRVATVAKHSEQGYLFERDGHDVAKRSAEPVAKPDAGPQVNRRAEKIRSYY